MEFHDDFLKNLLLATLLIAAIGIAGIGLMIAAGALLASLGFRLNRVRHPPAVAPIRLSEAPPALKGGTGRNSAPPMDLPLLLGIILLGVLGGALAGVFLALVFGALGVLADPLGEVAWSLARFGGGLGAVVAVLVVVGKVIFGLFRGGGK